MLEYHHFQKKCLLKYMRLMKRRSGFLFSLIFIWIIPTWLCSRNGMWRRIRVRSMITFWFQVICTHLFRTKMVNWMQMMVNRLAMTWRKCLKSLKHLHSWWFTFLGIMIQLQCLKRILKRGQWLPQISMQMFICAPFNCGRILSFWVLEVASQTVYRKMELDHWRHAGNLSHTHTQTKVIKLSNKI